MVPPIGVGRGKAEAVFPATRFPNVFCGQFCGPSASCRGFFVPDIDRFMWEEEFLLSVS